MNLEEPIAKIFENNTYSDLFKIRSLYLFICRNFSYDIRFIYANEILKEEIYNKQISLNNVDDFEIVCYTIARVLVDILNFYGYKCEIVREYKNKFSHAYVIVKCKDYVLKLDPTKRHDLTRVKMNSNTYDFTTIEENHSFIEELKEADKIITSNYENTDRYVFYDNETILKLTQTIEQGAKDRNLSECELFFEKIYYLFCLINTRTDLKRYDDMDYYFSYLIKKFGLNEKIEIINGKPIVTKINRIKPAIFFKKDDKSMRDIINIAIIEYENLPLIFYLIKKDGEYFKAREILRDEAIEILRQYHNPVCQFMFESAALRLPAENIRKSF